MVGRHILDDFEKYNVNTEAIQVERGANSGVATILVNRVLVSVLYFLNGHCN